MSEYPKCFVCGTQLSHIDQACPICLPHFYGAQERVRREPQEPGPHEDSIRLNWLEKHCMIEGTTMAMPRYRYQIDQKTGQPGLNIRHAIDADMTRHITDSMREAPID